MEEKRKTSAAQLAAAARYHAKVRTIRFYLTPEEGKELELHCAKTGESMNAFIKRAIAEAKARDTEERF